MTTRRMRAARFFLGSFGSPHDLEEIFRLEAARIIDVEASWQSWLPAGTSFVMRRAPIKTITAGLDETWMSGIMTSATTSAVKSRSRRKQ